MQIARLAHSKSTTKNAMLHFSSAQGPYSATAEPGPFVAFLTDPTTGNKVGVVDLCILADIAIVDLALTDGLPAQVTAAAGIDALVHVVEAFIARAAAPLADGLALEAARAHRGLA